MIQLSVSIMGQAYKLACKEGEQAALQEAVAYLNEKMCAIRDVGKLKGNDRIAVMAALGIAAVLEQPERFAGRRVTTILCGSNVGPADFARWVLDPAARVAR